VFAKAKLLQTETAEYYSAELRTLSITLAQPVLIKPLQERYFLNANQILMELCVFDA